MIDTTKFGVLIPIHQYTDDMKSLVTRAISSIPSNYSVYIVAPLTVPTESLAFIEEIHKEGEIIKIDSELGKFSTLVNYGFDYIKQQGKEWVYLLEYDDEFNSLWFDETICEMEDKPDVSVFLPLTEIVDYQTNKFISYGNEAPWASSFSNEIGFIDNESLQQFFDFYLTGSLFNLQDWVYVGGLKESFELTFWYEYLLRLTHNDKKAYVIPKLGYKHYVNRPDSLYGIYYNTMDETERKWWYDLALEEYAYKKDRNKTYKKEIEK